MEMLLPLKTIP